MQVEKGIHNLLAASTALTSAVGSRIYNANLPEGNSFPTCTYIITYERPIQHAAGYTESYEIEFDVGVWTKSYGESRELGRAIRAAVVGKTYHSPDGTLEIFSPVEIETSLYPPEADSELCLVEVTFSTVYHRKE